jgi:outer membrane protein assembly factor BamB
MRGQRTRCPNPSCRDVFEVQEAPEAPRAAPEPRARRDKVTPIDEPRIQESPTPLKKSSKTGPGREPVPILPAASVPQVTDWHQQLPPRRSPGAEEDRPPRMGIPVVSRKAAVKPSKQEVVDEVLPVATEGGTEPVELPSGAWEAPPARLPALSDGNTGSRSEQARKGPAEADDSYVRPPAARHAWKIVAVLVFVVVGILGVAGYVTYQIINVTKEDLAAAAENDFKDGQFHAAAKKFGDLLTNADSENEPKYRFFKELSELLDSMTGLAQPQSRDRLEKLETFLSEFKEKDKDNQFFDAHADQLGKAVAQYLKNVPIGPDPPPELIEFVDEANKVLVRFNHDCPNALKSNDRTEIDARFAEVHLAFTQAKQRKEFIADLQQLVQLGGAEAIMAARTRLSKETRTQPGLAQNRDVVSLFNQLFAEHQQKIVYSPANLPPTRKAVMEDTGGVLVNAVVGDTPEAFAAEERMVFAVARGVLYALSQETGRVRWATRVGVDVTSLPMRLPAAFGKPEMLLLLTGEARTLNALDSHDGSLLWRVTLPSPCLCNPLVVDSRVFLPTVSGLVLDIELANGKVLGQYNLGQRLSVGGARLEGTKFIFVPADELCVYILDTATQQCVGILYTEHLAGSLRGEPIVLADQAANPNQLLAGNLILGQTAGLDAWTMRAYSLPQAGQVAKPDPLPREPRLPGWPWYPPFRDSEKLVQVTDASALGLFGLRQPNNQDPTIFPLLSDAGFVDLSPWLLKTDETSRGPSSRKQAQVVLSLDTELWILVQDQLLRLQMTMGRKNGPTVVPSPHWPAPLPLGSPLHASQVDESASILFLVTRPTHQATCQAAAVYAEDGVIKWKNQLGVVCQGEPIILDKELLVLDQGCGLFRFDPDKHPNVAQSAWQIGNNYVAAAVDNTTPASSYLIRGTDGNSAIEVSLPKGAEHLLVRSYRPPQDGKPFAVDNQKLALNLKSKTSLAGPPALRGNSLLLPLTDKSLLGVQLPVGGGARPDPPNWRARSAPPDARGYVVWINDNEFVTTNGMQGLTHWRWPQDGPCQSIPPERDADRPTIQLPANIVSLPVTLKGERDSDPVQLFVADANRTLYAFSCGNLELAPRRWVLQGKITAGPFVRGKHVGCVVDGRRLVWIDPAKERPLWEYRTAGDEIVGEPGVVANMVVVADQSGRFVGLDPADGLPIGPGYTLSGNVSPVCSPVAFGPDRAFAPLADGTIFLLSLQRLRNPFAGFLLTP